jgi:hypothetical protein
MVRIGELLLDDIGALSGDLKVVTWRTASARGEFKMRGTTVVGVARAAAAGQLAGVCHAGGGVLVYAVTGERARDGRPILHISGYGCSQFLFTRMAREDVEWNLTHDPKTFEPVPPGHLVQYID